MSLGVVVVLLLARSISVVWAALVVLDAQEYFDGMSNILYKLWCWHLGQLGPFLLQFRVSQLLDLRNKLGNRLMESVVSKFKGAVR
jgi:hypothetical protein